MKYLLQFLEKELSIPSYVVPEVFKYFTEEYYVKGDYLVRQNYYCQKLLFVEQGFFRFHSKSEEKSITHWIFGANQFITDISSYFQGERAKWNIEAIANTQSVIIKV